MSCYMYIDDILVMGATEEHMKNLNEVLTRHREHRVRRSAYFPRNQSNTWVIALGQIECAHLTRR